MSKLHLRHICLAVGLAVSSAYAADMELSTQGQPTVVGNASTNGEWRKGGMPSGGAESVYIVQLADPAVATYEGGIKGLKATSNKVTGANKLNTNSKASKAYRKYLKQKQEKFAASSGSAKVTAQYQWAFNGVAMRLSEDEAEAMRANPEVKRVFKERIEAPTTDNGPRWISADSIWGGPPNNVPHSQGEGIVIAVLDTGINHDNPSFADVGGDGYDHSNPLGSGNYLPGSYCDTTDPGFCNDKLIGAWSFVPGDANYPSPEDSDGHGSHTASTSGGNVVLDATVYGPTTSVTRSISGVAPHANIIAYDVCTAGCPGSALLAAIDQVVVDASNLPDGIHALNYSISGGEDPYNDAIEIGFLNATAAGVFVSASAGNAGPGASTLGHQSPWVATTAASTHDRKLANSLVGMTSDADDLGDITSVGFTAGYGPASIVYAGDFPTANGSNNDIDPAQCLDPFPAGHFSGEIVVCDRGSIARTAKGANVLAGGAGGFVLANLAAQGEGVSGDAHFLPGIHVGVSAGDTLKAWIAANTNPVAEITGYFMDVDDANADITASFSSRGPNSTLDILKPDITAPGVDILAAVNTTVPGQPAEYGFISGTSMSSPHNAGAGAIVSAARPDWTPYEVKSAIMMTTDNGNVLKEDGVTPADPFDVGAGRVNLARAVEADLVLSETPLNMWLANPDTGGDPRQLNIASMQDGACLKECSFTRTFTNTDNHTVHVDVSASGDGVSVSPASLKIKGGKSASITVAADTRTLQDWNFGQIDLTRRGDGPDLHLPLAVNAVKATSPNLFSKTVDLSEASPGDILTYQLNITNGPITGEIALQDMLPGGVSAIPGSEVEVINGGVTSEPLAINGDTVSWKGTLDPGQLLVVDAAGTSPGGGYLPLSLFVAPLAPPASLDEGALILNVPSFVYNGETHNQVIMSVNGTLEAGAASGLATGWVIDKMPVPAPPNNLMAPFWSDLNLAEGGDLYAAQLCGGGFCWMVLEWANISQWGAGGDPAASYSFQVWLQNDGSGNIWYTYGGMGDMSYASVGAENKDGTVGSSFYFSGDGTGTPPVSGTEAFVLSQPGGSAELSFQAEVNSCETLTNEAEISSSDGTESAIAVTTCSD
jgi:uncharacterized repeat protein (TIGR01451 family)